MDIYKVESRKAQPLGAQMLVTCFSGYYLNERLQSTELSNTAYAQNLMICELSSGWLNVSKQHFTPPKIDKTPEKH
jgi:hypothetical protein